MTQAEHVLIVDSGLRHLGGHNHSYTQAISGVLKQRGFHVDVLTHKYVDPEFARTYGYQPEFTSGTYDFAPGNGKVRDLLYVYAQSVIFSAELERALKARTTAPVLIISHTLSEFELIGWSRFLSRNRFDGRLALVMRTTPQFAGRGRMKLLLHPYWRIRPHYLNSIRGRLKDRFVLATDSELLTADYRNIYRGEILTLPIPLSARLFEAARIEESNALRIGYLGDARDLKGFDLLPGMASRLLGGTDSVRMIIQCPPPASGRDDSATPNGVPALIKLAATAGDRLTLIRERLSDAAYCDLLQQLDIVLIPYMQRPYALATSAIFAEAMALGKPVVVPAGTWMSHELQKSGGGLEFESGNAGDLADKVTRLMRSYGDYAGRARAFSGKWREFHNARKLVDLLLGNSSVSSNRAGVAPDVQRLVSIE